MSFRDLFNHVIKESKYDEKEEIVEEVKETKKVRKLNRKKYGMKESRMIRRTRLNEESFETYYKKFKNKPLLKQSYENYTKEQYKDEIKPVSFRKWMQGLWKDDQKNESIKVHENIRRRRKEKAELQDATVTNESNLKFSDGEEFDTSGDLRV